MDWMQGVRANGSQGVSRYKEVQQGFQQIKRLTGLVYLCPQWLISLLLVETPVWVLRILSKTKEKVQGGRKTQKHH